MANSAWSGNTDGLASATSPGLVGTGTQTFAGNKTFTGDIVPATPFCLRNKIINGNFDIWQRGTSYSGNPSGVPTNPYGLVAADRFFLQAYAGTSGSGTANISMSQQPFSLGQTSVPGEPSYFLRCGMSQAATQGGINSFIKVRQSIEDVRTFAGQTVTLSFWAKADTARTYAVIINQNFGTGGSPSSIQFGAQSTFSVTSSWQYTTLTFTLPSISGKTLGTNNNSFLDVTFILYKQDNSFGDTLGPIGTWSITPYLDLSKVQLEAGSVATPFEQRPIGMELGLCQRYYEIGSLSWLGCFTAAGTARASAYFRVTKRVVPTIYTTTKVYSDGTLTGVTPAAVNPDVDRVGIQFVSTGSSANSEMTVNWACGSEL
jgi:hypothetical protein